MASVSQSDSQDTASSVVEDSLNISFENIVYTVRNGIFSKGRKTVLAGLSGCFSAGELTVLMGQSGAGKSSLMDILAGYTNPTSGSVFVNGRLRNMKTFRKRSCYILQDDKIQEFLTTQESLTVAAELKLGNHVSKDQKARRIQEIMISLGLSHSWNTLAGCLSGGQKKRLAIGLELVSDPPVMFLDEPTSGLDSSISKSMVKLLNLLARQGRTVIATMHQPSAALLQLVDRLYAIVGGRCAYIGSVPMLLPYLELLELRCPPYHNPVDFLIEICVEKASDLVLHSQNGKETDWIPNMSKTDSQVEKLDISQGNSTLDEFSLTTLPAPKEDPTNKILMKLKSTYSTTFWKQFTILTKRSLLSHWRNPYFTVMFTGIHCAMASLIGILFYNIGEDAKYARNNYNCLFFSLMFLMFTAFSAVTVTFPQQFPVVRREHFNRWYMTGAYYWSTLISVLPTQTVCTLAYTCIIYFMTGQPHDFVRFISYCWTLMLVSYVALCIGLLNGSMFNVKEGVVFGPFFIMPFVIFSGFFLLYKDAPIFCKWLFHISFLKHGLVALTIGMYGMNRPKMHCSSTEMCFYAYPKQILIENDMVHEEIWIPFVALMGISVVLNIGTYAMLKIRLKAKW